MTNAERLRQSTELLAARGQGMRDGLRWVLRKINSEISSGYWPDVSRLADEITRKLDQSSEPKEPNNVRTKETISF